MFESILEVLAKVTVLLLLAWALTSLLRGRAAAVRHLIWACSLIGAVALPVVECVPGLEVLPSWRPEPSSAAEGEESRRAMRSAGPFANDGKSSVADGRAEPAFELPAAEDGGVGANTSLADLESGAERAGSAESPARVPRLAVGAGGDPAAILSRSRIAGERFAWEECLAVLWGLGVIWFVLRIVSGWRTLRGIVRRAKPCEDDRVLAWLADARRQLGVRTDLELILCEHSCGPMTWGIFRSFVALPAVAVEWTDERIRGVLLHELAHVRRRDCLVQLAGRTARALYWFHPLVWLASRRLHDEQERACDDFVLGAGVRASAYAEDLMRIASGLRPMPAAALVSTAIARPSDLVARMKYLLDAGQVRKPLARGTRILTAAGVLVAALALGAARSAPSGEAAVPDDVPQDKQTAQDKQDKAKLAARLIGLLDLATHREQAIRELAAIGDPAIPGLKKAMDDKRSAVVDGAVRALAQSKAKNGKLIPLLLGVAVDKDRPAALRRVAVSYLGPRIDEDPKVFEALLAIMDESGDPNLAVDTLHFLTGSQAHRKKVAELLATRLPGPGKKASDQAREIDKLINSLGAKPRTGRSANRELVRLGSVAYPQLVRALRHPREDTRRRVLALLLQQRLFDSRLTAELVSLIAEPAWSSAERVRIGRALAACLKKDPETVDHVLKVLSTERCHGRPEMIDALLGLDSRSARKNFDALTEILLTAEEELALMILEGFGRLPLHSSRALASRRYAAYLEALGHSEPEVVAASIRALSGVFEHAEETRIRIQKFADHRSDVVRTAHAKFLSVLVARKKFRRPGVLVADYSDNRIVEFDSNGKARWILEDIFGVWDVEKLTNGNYLITEFSVNRVSEITPANKVVWQFENLKNPYDADRLPNGNTLIADTFGRRVIEVDKAGTIVWKYDTLIHPYDVDRLPNGNTLIADTHDDRVIEVDPKGKIVWQIKNVQNVHDADRLPNGNTLLTIRMLNEVREVDRLGRTVWSLKNLSSPSDADRLPDGSTMVAENGFVRIFGPDGGELWKKAVTWAVEANILPPGK